MQPPDEQSKCAPWIEEGDYADPPAGRSTRLARAPPKEGGALAIAINQLSLRGQQQ